MHFPVVASFSAGASFRSTGLPSCRLILGSLSIITGEYPTFTPFQRHV